MKASTGVAALFVLVAGSALAATPPPAASIVPSGAPAASAVPSAAPANKPATGPSAVPGPHGDAALPAGHPPTDSRPLAPEGPNPDQVGIDPELPAGSIFVHLVDASDMPIGGAPIVLDIDRNTVAQGESHDERAARVDPKGEAQFVGLKVGGGTSYRVRTQRDGATFASPSFMLKTEGGAQVLLHSHEVVKNLSEARFVIEAFVVLEVKQDTVRVNHLLRTFTFGPAFLAQGLTMKLPPGARAFSQEESATGISLREHNGEVSLQGTFPPGQAELTYGYTLPLENGPTLGLRLPLPPRVLAAQVSVNAGPGMSLTVAGFAPAQPSRRRDGQKVLQALRQLEASKNPAEFLANVTNGELDVTVQGLPSNGNGPIVAATLAALALALGAAELRKSGTKSDKAALALELSEARDALLGELTALEAARATGEVGPKSYERLRTALVDALARVLAKLETR